MNYINDTNLFVLLAFFVDLEVLQSGRRSGCLNGSLGDRVGTAFLGLQFLQLLCDIELNVTDVDLLLGGSHVGHINVGQ